MPTPTKPKDDYTLEDALRATAGLPADPEPAPAASEKDLTTWSCKIGEVARGQLPPGSDGPMRKAVAAAYQALAGEAPRFIFSGWGAELTEAERAVVENRLPRNGSAKPAAAGMTVEREAQIHREFPHRAPADHDDPLCSTCAITELLSEVSALRTHLATARREERERLALCKAGLEGARDAADELMTEFVSKQRAANWSVVNGGLVAADKALAAIRRLDDEEE